MTLLLASIRRCVSRGSNQPFAMHATCMFATGDIEAAYQSVQEAGAEPVTAIFREPNVAFFNFEDPDGNIQMICAAKH